MYEVASRKKVQKIGDLLTICQKSADFEKKFRINYWIKKCTVKGRY
jgi:hypothetical protein